MTKTQKKFADFLMLLIEKRLEFYVDYQANGAITRIRINHAYYDGRDVYISNVIDNTKLFDVLIENINKGCLQDE